MAIFNWKPKLVLPTVYDDALSYQEILGKVIDALNQMGETGKLVNAVFPNGDPVVSVRDNGINVVGKAKIVYMDGKENDCDIDVMIPLAKGDNVNFAVVDGVVKIFATNTTYTGGNGIVFEGTVIKANYDEVQRKLTAGEGIVIQGATIAIDPSVIGGALVAGNGITVTGNTISVDYSKVQAKLTAGNGITVTGNTISVDDSKVQAKLTAGEGIAIEGNVIKATGNGEGVVITLPESGVSGTLTEAQFNTLVANDNNWITVNNERYVLMDKEHTLGIRTYTHDGYNERGVVKYLNLTVSTRAFTIVETKNLTLPNVAPPDEAIVTVGVDNQQSQLFLGYGLSISANTIVTDIQMSLSGTTLNITNG